VTAARRAEAADGPAIRGRRLTVILKASDRCNGACAYCSVGPAGRHTMTWEAFETLARELERLVERWGLRGLNLTFHGGEPTLLGTAFIDRACRRLRRLPVPVTFLLQSNLLKVTAPMIEVIERHDIVVGTSFDPLTGRRRLADGSDAWQRWRRSYLACAARGVAPGAIFVVTRPALGRARELFAAADAIAAESGRRFGIQLNPIYGQGRAASEDDLLVTPQEFGRFLVDAWTIWEETGRRHGLNPVRSFVDAIERPRRRHQITCSFAGNCAATHVGVDHALNVAGCGRRLDSKAFLGNLGERPLVDILETSEERRLVATRAARLAEGPCRGCRFFGLCHGGCPDDACLAAGDLMARHDWCAAYTMLFEAITERVERTRAARRPPRPAPQPAPSGPPRLVVLRAPGDDACAPPAGDLPGAPADARETWLLAEAAPGWLEFDGTLAAVVAATPGPIRLWLSNRRVPALALWQDVARRPLLRVGLFEADELDEALGLLNSLRARVVLDVAAIGGAADGPAALAAALERFLTAPGWAVPVDPFAEVLQAAVAGRPLHPATRFGLAPGGFEVRGAPPVAGPATAVTAALARDAALTRDEWRSTRRACARCAWRAPCAGRLALADGTCPPAQRRLAERLGAAAGDIVARLRAARPTASASRRPRRGRRDRG
jgi:uncharacterized protein